MNKIQEIKGFETLFKGKNLNFKDIKITVNLIYYNKQGSSYEGFKDYVYSDLKMIFT